MVKPTISLGKMEPDKVIESIDLIIEEIQNEQDFEDVGILEFLTREEAINMQMALIKTIILIN